RQDLRRGFALAGSAGLRTGHRMASDESESGGVMQEAGETWVASYRERIARLQQAMKEFGLRAIVLESGPGMMYLTGVRWGRSERTFAVVLPATGEPVWVLPGFEEQRARELIHLGNDDIRVWQEDESPYQRIVEGLEARGVTTGRVGIDDTARFFVF